MIPVTPSFRISNLISLFSSPGPSCQPPPPLLLYVLLRARRTRRRRRPTPPHAGHPRLLCRVRPPLALILPRATPRPHPPFSPQTLALLPMAAAPPTPLPPPIRRPWLASLRFLAPGASPPSPRRILLLTRPPPSPHRAAGESLGPPPPNAVAPPPRRRSPPSELPVRLTANASTPCAPSLPCSGLNSPRRLAPRRRRRRRARRGRVHAAPRDAVGALSLGSRPPGCLDLARGSR